MVASGGSRLWRRYRKGPSTPCNQRPVATPSYGMTAMRGIWGALSAERRKTYLLKYRSGGLSDGSRSVSMGADGGPGAGESAAPQGGDRGRRGPFGRAAGTASRGDRRRGCRPLLSLSTSQCDDRASTAAEVRRAVKRKIKPALGAIRISALSRADVSPLASIDGCHTLRSEPGACLPVEGVDARVDGMGNARRQPDKRGSSAFPNGSATAISTMTRCNVSGRRSALPKA